MPSANKRPHLPWVLKLLRVCGEMEAGRRNIQWCVDSWHNGTSYRNTPHYRCLSATRMGPSLEPQVLGWLSPPCFNIAMLGLLTGNTLFTMVGTGSLLVFGTGFDTCTGLAYKFVRVWVRVRIFEPIPNPYLYHGSRVTGYRLPATPCRRYSVLSPPPPPPL